MKVKFKKLSENAVTPSYAKDGDAGLDLTCTRIEYDDDNNIIKYHTDIAVEIPRAHVGLLLQRSSVYKKASRQSNGVGVIDSGYRGEIIFFHDSILAPEEGEQLRFDFLIESDPEEFYEVGDRVGQLIIIPYPHIELEEVKELKASERGDNGFGSTGK